MRLIPLLGTLLASNALHSADWPQYRGPNHDGISLESILTQWPATGPKVLWKTPLTDGFSSFAVDQAKAFTLVKRAMDGQDQEMCIALDANTGKELWAQPLGLAKYDGGGDSGAPDNRGGDGPRSTPSIDGNAVYVLSAYLNLVCLDAASGKLLWNLDLAKELGCKPVAWQNAASPLIDDQLIFINANAPGQALVAINKHDGKIVWKRHDQQMTHATPIAATILNTRQIIFFTQSGLVSLVPQTGDILWTYKFRYSVSTAASPVVGKDIVYCSAGYNVGSAAIKISKEGRQFVAAELWKIPGNTMASHWSTPVHYEGYLYGLFGFKDFAKAPLRCINIATGKEMWSAPGFGPGGVILAGDHLIVLGDKGQLALVKASPESYKEIARFQALAGKCWNAPALSNGRIFARSTKEGICIDVSPK